MKSYFFVGSLATCLMASLSLCGQVMPHAAETNKASFFSSLPQNISLSTDKLQQIFRLELTDKVNIQLNDLLIIEGTVIDKIQRKSGVISMNIRLSNFPGALLNLSLSNLPLNKQAFTGRILHPSYGDSFVLTVQNDHYTFRKLGQHELMVE